MPRPNLHVAIDERSPLLIPRKDNEDSTDVEVAQPPTDQDFWETETEPEETKPWWYLVLLTISICGLQIVWSVELGSGSPYLLSLGIKKSILAFVWLAGPLTGVLVQPYVGLKSDNCRMTWGRRKPFMVGGGAATIIALLALSRATEIVGGLNAAFGHNPDAAGVRVGAAVFATAMMYILDFAINTGKSLIHPRHEV